MKTIASAGLAAVAVSLMASSALAATFTNASFATYATQAIPASGAVTIPGGALFTSDTFTTGAGGGSVLLTITLPTGVTFVTNPSASVGTNFALATLSGGGTGQNFAVFTITLSANVAAATGTLTLNSFQVTGATALSTPTASTAFQFSEQASGATGTTPAGALNQVAAVKAPLGASASQLTYSFAVPLAVGPGTNNAAVVDTAAPSNGTKFKQGGAAVAVADLGSTSVLIGTNTNATATAPFTFTATKATETVTGNLAGITSAFNASGACAATSAAEAAVAGAVAGVISGSNITFSNVPFTTVNEICLYAGGSLLANNTNFATTVTVDTSSAPLTTGGGVTPAALSGYLFNGANLSVLYSTANANGYTSFIRIVNSSGAAATVTAVVTSDAGASGTATVETSLAANANDLVSVQTIAAAAGVSSANTRLSIQLFGPTGVGFENLLLNPGGVVSQIQ